MKQLYRLLFVCLMGSGTLFAQTLPCAGGQVLAVCDCDQGVGTLIADAAPCDFSTATNQGYLLVDAISDLVTDDLDDGSIVGYNSTGVFANYPTGDYLVYYLTYDVDDAAEVLALVEIDDPIVGLLSLAAPTSGDFWISNDPSFSLLAAPLASINGPECGCNNLDPCTGINCTIHGHQGSAIFDGVNITGDTPLDYTVHLISNVDGSVLAVIDETTALPAEYNFDNGTAHFELIELETMSGCVYDQGDPIPDGWVVETADFMGSNCEDFQIIAEAICGLNSYTVVVGLDGATSYNVSSPTGFNGVVSGSFLDGPFVLGTGFSYTVSDVANPTCETTSSQPNIDCVVTALNLVSFEGRFTDSGNELFWTTASESETDFFSLERSADGQQFELVGTVAAAGFSATNRNYRFLDKSNLPGDNYYRLREHSRSGENKIVSGIVNVRREYSFEISAVHPIPAKEFIQIDFNSTAGSATIEMYDLSGRLMNQFNYSTVQGLNSLQIKLNEYPVGSYLISISNSEETIIARFIKAD